MQTVININPVWSVYQQQTLTAVGAIRCKGVLLKMIVYIQRAQKTGWIFHQDLKGALKFTYLEEVKTRLRWLWWEASLPDARAVW